MPALLVEHENEKDWSALMACLCVLTLGQLVDEGPVLDVPGHGLAGLAGVEGLEALKELVVGLA